MIGLRYRHVYIQPDAEPLLLHGPRAFTGRCFWFEVMHQLLCAEVFLMSFHTKGEVKENQLHNEKRQSFCVIEETNHIEC